MVYTLKEISNADCFKDVQVPSVCNHFHDYFCLLAARVYVCVGEGGDARVGYEEVF